MELSADAAQESLKTPMELSRESVSGAKEGAIKSRHCSNHRGKLQARKVGSPLSKKNRPHSSLVYHLLK